MGAFVLLALTRGSPHIRGFFVVVIAAAASLAWVHAVPQAFARGYERAQVFGAFLPSVLLLRATVEASPLLPRLLKELSRLDDASLRNWTLYGTHALGTVLNVGAMSMLAPVVTHGADAQRRRGLAGASGRGIALDIMWSPFFVSTPFTIQLVSQAALWQVMPLGLALAAIGFALTYCMLTPSLDAARFRESLAQLRPVVLPAVLLIGAVLAVNAAFGLGALQSVALVVPVLCVAYLASLGPQALRSVARRTAGNFARLSEEMLIVVGAMCLAAVVAALPAVQALATSVTPGVIPWPLLMGGLVVALVAVGMLGLHPMIGVGILVPVLASAPFGICPSVLVATAVFAWGLNGALSPWALPLAAASAHFGVPVRELVTRGSVFFVLAYFIAGLSFLAAANLACR